MFLHDDIMCEFVLVISQIKSELYMYISGKIYNSILYYFPNLSGKIHILLIKDLK